MKMQDHRVVLRLTHVVLYVCSTVYQGLQIYKDNVPFTLSLNCKTNNNMFSKPFPTNHKVGYVRLMNIAWSQFL